MRPSYRQGAARILLVEDNEDDVFLTLRALRKIGVQAEVEVARDGVEAVEQLSVDGGEDTDPGSPAVILLDLKLPRMTGVEVLDWLGTQEAVRRIPIVIVSSSKEDLEQLQVDERKAGDASGTGRNVIDFVPKSLTYEEFCERLEIVKEFLRP